MWAKLTTNAYFETEHSTLIGVSGGGGLYHIELLTPYTGVTTRRLAEGYTSAEEAQEALDDFMSEVGYSSIDPPESEEIDDEGEVEESTLDYSEMTADELRAELSQRGLPTSGSKADMTNRLTEDDAQANLAANE